nr:T9SS type A sorting domain-containing protein [Bacteroidia bacterium]
VCGINSSPRCRTISSNKPATPGNVTGAATGICGQTITYSIAAVAGATSYTWTPPAGASLSTPNGNNSVDVTYSPGFTTGNLCVTANNGCGSSTPRCIIAKGTPSNPGIISGPSTVCASQSGTVYSIAPVFGATGYIWATPSGTTINSGQGTTSINVDWGSNGGTVAVTAQSACGNSGTRTLAVVMNCKVSGSQLPGSELNVYPNPVSTQLTIELDAAKSGAYSVEIVDLAGRVVYSEVINAAAGINNNVIDVADYAKGVYTLSVKNNDGFVKQVRVAVQ